MFLIVVDIDLNVIRVLTQVMVELGKQQETDIFKLFLHFSIGVESNVFS